MAMFLWKEKCFLVWFVVSSVCWIWNVQVVSPVFACSVWVYLLAIETWIIRVSWWFAERQGHVATKHRESSCKISIFWLLLRMGNGEWFNGDSCIFFKNFQHIGFFVRLQPWRVWYSSRVSARLPRWVLSGTGNSLRSLWRCFYAGKKQLKVMIKAFYVDELMKRIA